MNEGAVQSTLWIKQRFEDAVDVNEDAVWRTLWLCGGVADGDAESMGCVEDIVDGDSVWRTLWMQMLCRGHCECKRCVEEACR